MNFALDILYSAIYCSFSHRQLHRYFYDRFAFNSHIKNRPLVLSKVAHPAEVVTLRLGELSLYIYIKSLPLKSGDCKYKDNSLNKNNAFCDIVFAFQFGIHLTCQYSFHAP